MNDWRQSVVSYLPTDWKSAPRVTPVVSFKELWKLGHTRSLKSSHTFERNNFNKVHIEKTVITNNFAYFTCFKLEHMVYKWKNVCNSAIWLIYKFVCNKTHAVLRHFLHQVCLFRGWFEFRGVALPCSSSNYIVECDEWIWIYKHFLLNIIRLIDWRFFLCICVWNWYREECISSIIYK